MRQEVLFGNQDLLADVATLVEDENLLPLIAVDVHIEPGLVRDTGAFRLLNQHRPVDQALEQQTVGCESRFALGKTFWKRVGKLSQVFDSDLLFLAHRRQHGWLRGGGGMRKREYCCDERGCGRNGEV